MLTAKDLQKRYKVSRQTIATWYAKRIIPEPLKIGGILRWREDDVVAWEDYLRRCRDYRSETGLDPHASDSPVSPPVYSTGIETLDPRHVNARLEERDRRERSKTLRLVTEPITDEPVDMPNVAPTDAATRADA